MNIKYKIIFLLSIFILSINQVKADTSIYLECPKSTVVGSSINCNVLATSDIELSAIRTKLTVSNNLKLISFTKDSSWQGNGDKGDIALYTYPNQKGTIKLGVVSVKVLNNKNNNCSLTLKNTNFYNSNFKAISGNNASKSINILSTNNNLSSITVNKENLTPKFDKNILSYNITTYNDSIVIAATQEDDGATISGLGSKKLEYGENNFTITVTSEAGTQKKYQIIVTRNKKATKEEQPIKENKNTTNDKKNNTTKKNSEANKSGTNKVEEKTNNEDIVNSIKDNKQSLKLKELVIEGYQIDFKEDNYNYQISLLNNEKTLNIKAIPIMDKTKVTITGNNNLKTGKNNITITLSSEDGNKTVYKIVATKQKNICILKNIKVANYKLPFDCNKYNYNLKIKKENSLNIDVIPIDKDTKINIYNNSNLKNKDIITISVKSGDKNYKYTIKVLKNEYSFVSIFILSILGTCLIGIIIKILLKKIKLK